MRSAVPPAHPGLSVAAGARPSTLRALAALVLTAFAVVDGGLLALGLLVTHVLARSAVHRKETAFEREVLAHRTALLDHLTGGGAVLAATTTVIALTGVGFVVVAVRRHGPWLPTFLVLAVAGDVLFLLAQLVLHRLRPLPIPNLDPAPPTSSFPSGHTAATLRSGEHSRSGSPAPSRGTGCAPFRRRPPFCCPCSCSQASSTAACTGPPTCSPACCSPPPGCCCSAPCC